MSAERQPPAGAASGPARDDAQRESSAFQRAILECADYAIISTTPDGVIRTFNRAAERMLGYLAEEVVGKVTPEIIHDYDEVVRRAAKLTEELGRPVPAGFETFVAKARQGLADEQEWTYVRKDGSRFPVQLSVTAMRDDTEEIIGFMGIAHNISRRREAQVRVGQLAAQLDRRVRERTAQVAASEERFRLVVEASPSGLVMVDHAGRIVLVNAQMERLFGYARAELLGQPVELLLPERVRAAHAGHRAAFFAAPTGRAMGAGRDLFARRKDGGEFPVEIGLSPIQTEDGPAVLATIVDISTRKAVEARQRASEERLKLAQQAARVGTFEWNIQTGTNIWSPELEAMYGLPPGGFPGTQLAWESLVHPDDLARAKGQVQRAFDTNESVEGEWRVVWPDGSTRWLVGRFQVFRDAAGQPLRLTGANLDITERKRAEQLTATLAELGQRLSAAETRRAAAGAVLDATDRMLHFDAALLHLLSPDRQRVFRVLTVDTVNGWRTEQSSPYEAREPSLMFRRVLRSGAQLVLRREPGDTTIPFEPFGDKNRQSASLMFVPMRAGTTTVGVLSLQSYTPHAFTQGDLDLLQTIADHAAGAFERLEAEDTLRESEQRFRGTFEQTAVGVSHVGLDGSWLRVNDWLCQLVGYSREELLKKTFQDITHPDDLAPDLENVRRLLAGEIPHYAMDKRYFHKDGSVIWIRLTVSLIRETDGLPSYFIAIIEDIRARKAAEQKLEETARFPGENPNPVLRVGQDGRITYANAASEAMLAMWQCGIGSPLPGPLGRTVAEALATGSRNVAEVPCGAQSFLLTIAPIPGAGYVNLYGQNITVRKRAEQISNTLAELGRQLGAVSSRRAAAEAMLAAIERLFAFDAVLFHLLAPDQRHVFRVLMLDTIAGRRVETPCEDVALEPTAMFQRVAREGAQLVLRGPPGTAEPNLEPFGDQTRLSASLMFVPVRAGGKVIGVLSAQSYQPGAYDAASLELLQALADYAGTGLARVAAHEESERLANLLWETQRVARLGCFEGDLRTGVDRWTDETFRQLGFAPGEIAPTLPNFLACIHPEDRDRIAENIARIARDAQSYESEYRVVRPDGSVRHLHSSVAAEMGAAGRVVRVYGAAQDITERKRTEAELRESRAHLEQRVQERTAELARLNMLLHSEVEDRKAIEEELRNREEQLRDLFENATDLIQSIAPDGRILFVNRAWLNALGYRMSELASLTMFDIIHPDCLGECREHFARVMQGEALNDFQAIFRAKDGRKIHVEGNANARFENGRPVATRGIFRDISKRKAAEEERERLIAELQAALAEVKTLSGLLPVCGWCKKIRDDSGYWNSVEGYLKKSSGVDITHGICPDCQARMMAELDKLTSESQPPPSS